MKDKAKDMYYNVLLRVCSCLACKTRSISHNCTQFPAMALRGGDMARRMKQETPHTWQRENTARHEEHMLPLLDFPVRPSEAEEI